MFTTSIYIGFPHSSVSQGPNSRRGMRSPQEFQQDIKRTFLTWRGNLISSHGSLVTRCTNRNTSISFSQKRPKVTTQKL